MKCYSSSSPKLVKGSSNSIRYNCYKICSWSRRLKTILEIKKRTHFSRWLTMLFIHKFFKDFTNHRKKTNRAIVFFFLSLSLFTISPSYSTTLSALWSAMSTKEQCNAQWKKWNDGDEDHHYNKILTNNNVVPSPCSITNKILLLVSCSCISKF